MEGHNLFTVFFFCPAVGTAATLAEEAREKAKQGFSAGHSIKRLPPHSYTQIIKGSSKSAAD